VNDLISALLCPAGHPQDPNIALSPTPTTASLYPSSSITIHLTYTPTAPLHTFAALETSRSCLVSLSHAPNVVICALAPHAAALTLTTVAPHTYDLAAHHGFPHLSSIHRPYSP
jgi:hypothetical protein